MAATAWYTHYPAIKSVKVNQFVQDGIKLLTELYGQPVVPIKKVRLCYSLPLDTESELRKHFQLCEMVDEEAGEFAIYLSHQPDAYSFHGQLGHEIAHLLNANMYDAYIEGLNTLFAEKLLTQENLDWSGWANYFQQGNDAFYAHTYHMMREIDEFLIDGELSNFLDFAEPISEESTEQKINIEAWLDTLSQEKRDVVKFIIFNYAARIEIARRKSHSVYHFAIPHRCSCECHSCKSSEKRKKQDD